MKQYNIIILFLALCINISMISSCEDSELLSNYVPAEVAYYLSLRENNVTMPSDASDETLYINSGANAWTIESSANWLSVSKGLGGALKIATSTNTSGESSRVGVIAISSKEGDWFANKTITVTQMAANAYINTSTSSVELEAGSKESIASASFTITTNTSWRCTSIPEWCSLDKTNGTAGTHTITITPTMNQSLDSRNGTIIFTNPSGGLIHKVSVIQKAQTFDSDVQQLAFTDKAGSKALNLNTNMTWIASTDADWVTITPNSGDNGGKITVSVSENNGTESRAAIVNVKTTGKTIQIAVSQESKYITLSSDAFSFAATGGNTILSLSTNYDWTAEVENNVSWVSVSPKSGSGNSDITISVTANNTANPRSAKVYIVAKDAKTYIITVTQGVYDYSQQQTFTANGVSFIMMQVKAGTFTMGATSEQEDPYSHEEPIHQVTLTKDYYIGQTEVTQELWEAVMGNNPSNFKGSKRPVEQVSWNDCQTFISKLNSLTGKTFRLPTEAEWEFAARGGNNSKGYQYSGSNNIGDVAWYSDNSNSTTHDVATKQPNELGIYDMSGNVWEWCQDWYGSYSSSSQTDPTGANSGSGRVYRGGSWCYNARCCRSAYRYCSTPDFTSSNHGLRLVLSENEIKVTGITLSSTTAEVDINKTLQLSATVSPSNATIKTLQWTSSNTSVATVSSSGLVTGVATGSATITARATDGSNISATCTVTVKNSSDTEIKQQTFTANGVSFTMMPVKAGTFTMGATSEQENPYSDEKPTHQVTLTNGYYIGQTEVTQELWQAVMGSNPSSFSGSKHPVEHVSWNDCQTFITKLNSLTGKSFRLPTEAEWEFAARGGNNSKGYQYSGSNNIGDVAWYRVNCYDKGSSSPDYGTHEVATKQSNELGIYDMSGNVREWCQDWYGSYSSSSQTDPTGANSGSSRVRRGGSWFNDARGCRSSYRYYDAPDFSDLNLGLRLALSE